MELPEDPLIKKQQSISLRMATLAAFITPFLGSALNVSLPSIGKELSMPAVSLSWIATGYLLAAGMALLPIGKAADIYGRKKFFRIGVWIILTSCVLAMIAPNSTFLLAMRIVEGFGAAFIFSTGTAIMVSLYPPQQRGKILGINTASVYSGLSLGPVVGGFITQHLGWRFVFLVPIVIILFVQYFASKLEGDWAEAKGHSFDRAGTAILSSSLLSLVLGMSFMPGIKGFVLVIIGITGLGLFWFWQNKTDSPLLEPAIFNNMVFALSNLAALINYAATYAVGFLLSLYLQYIQGLPPQKAGLVLLAQPITMALFSPFSGRLSDKVQPRVLSSLGMGMCALGLLAFSFLNHNTAIWQVVVGLLFLGIGFGLFSSPNTNAVMSSVEKKYLGLASGTLGSMRLLGQVMSMGGASLVFAIYIGNVKITPESYPAFLTALDVMFKVCCGLCVLGIWASLSRGNLKRQHSVKS